MSQSPTLQSVPKPSLSPQRCPATAKSVFPCLGGQLLTEMAILGLTQLGWGSWWSWGWRSCQKDTLGALGGTNTEGGMDAGEGCPALWGPHGCCPTFGDLGSCQPGPDQAVPLPEAQDLHLGEPRHVHVQLLLQVLCRGHRVTTE